jgi:hypothetical protein
VSVKVIPISPEYREGWDRIFAGKDGSPAGLISQPAEFDSPTRYQNDNKDLREEARVMLRHLAKNVLKNDTPAPLVRERG